MKQYCRYCTNLIVADTQWCDLKEKEIKENTAKAPNKCKDFEFNPIDAFGENEKGYTPHHKKDKKDGCDNQLSFNF